MWVAVSKNNSNNTVKTEQLIGGEYYLRCGFFDSRFTHLTEFQWEYWQGEERFVIGSSLKF